MFKINLDFQITEYPEWRENKSKCNPVVEEILKTSDMSNKLHAHLKQTTVTKDIYKGKYRLVATKQQKTNVNGNMDSLQYLEPEYKNKTIINRQNKAKK